MTSAPPRTRSVEELEYFLNWLPTSSYAEDRSVQGADYLIGVRNAVEWVLGRQHSSPVSCRHSDQPPDRSRIGMEHSTAESGMRWGAQHIREDYRLREDETQVFSRMYFTAVEHTLWYVLGGDSFSLPEDWPWPAELNE
jgi:hypothetical protein